MKNLLEFALNHIIIITILFLIIIIVTGFVKYKNFVLHSHSVDFGSHGFHESETRWNWKFGISFFIDIVISIITFILYIYSLITLNGIAVISLSIFIILFIIIFVETATRSEYHP